MKYISIEHIGSLIEALRIFIILWDHLRFMQHMKEIIRTWLQNYYIFRARFKTVFTCFKKKTSLPQKYMIFKYEMK